MCTVGWKNKFELVTNGRVKTDLIHWSREHTNSKVLCVPGHTRRMGARTFAKCDWRVKINSTREGRLAARRLHNIPLFFVFVFQNTTMFSPSLIGAAGNTCKQYPQADLAFADRVAAQRRKSQEIKPGERILGCSKRARITECK